MSREITVERIEDRFDDLFRDLEQITDNLSERNSVSLKMIYEAYQEDKENR